MKTITIKWRSKDESPLYQQLYQQIKNEIVAGRLVYGTRLPSKKQLERSLNISQTTVETAYSQLISEGYIDSVPRRGYFVAAKEELSMPKATRGSMVDKPKSRRKQRFDYDFSPGQIDCSLFPFNKWRSLYREAISQENQHLLMLGSPAGEELLREEIRNHLYQSRGVVCSIDQIIIGAGIEQLLPQLVFLLGNSSVYAVENPGYKLTRHVLSSNQRRSLLLDVDAEGAIIERLAELPANVVYVTPSHQFPLGSIMSINRRIALLNWAYSAKDRYIIEDDYDSEFRYFGRPVPSLYSLGEGKKVIYLSTFSKSLIPSLRVGYMVLPRALIENYKREFSHYASCVSRIDQQVLGNFMKSGDFARHLNRMRIAYRKKVETIIKILEPSRGSIEISGETAGLHLLLSFSGMVKESELIDLARKAGVKVVGLSNFYHEPSQKSAGIVLGFGNMTEEKIGLGLQRLIGAWEK